MNNKFKVIGLMSGTSLDGLDIACCTFLEKEGKWNYEVENAVTIRYPRKVAASLAGAMELSGAALMTLNAAYGRFIGESLREFLSENKWKPDFIASHGHTVFHQPGNSFTTQIGDGNAIHAITGIPVIYDFRSLDVALSGQGAPLVPVGDELLFADYDYCLNIGGIANVSMRRKKQRVAFDVCFANMGFNYLMNQKGKAFDNRGETAAAGEVNKSLLNQLTKHYNSLRNKRPSLGKEMFDSKFRPIIDKSKLSVEDKLATLVESAALEIAQSLEAAHGTSAMLCTGGGAFNSYLIARMLDHCGDSVSLVIPDDNVVKFKEALIFAFLGVLRVRGQINCLKTVTGAIRDSSAGVMVGF